MVSFLGFDDSMLYVDRLSFVGFFTFSTGVFLEAEVGSSERGFEGRGERCES